MDVAIKDVITTSISVASFAVVLLRPLGGAVQARSRLKMTPAPLCFASSASCPACGRRYFCGLCSLRPAPKDDVIENMFLRVRQDYGTYTFDFWGHTENGKLTLGSGLFVGATGVASDHHFNPREGLDEFLYVGGEYLIEVFATTVRTPRAREADGIDLHRE